MRWLIFVLGVALGVAWTRGARAGDPRLEWWTIATPHFRIHYHGGLEDLAQRTATLAEGVHTRLQPELGPEPSEVTNLVLADDSDAANGVATSRPYNMIRLFVASPPDMSTLGDYDDWNFELVTHEYTHILHVDNVSGAPAIVNAIFGKVLTPNQSQPRFLLEGLAVALESRHTTGGRIRNTQFDMYLRADVLEERFARLDEISNNPRRWPGAQLWYLYGGRFVEWIMDIYGPDTFAAVATHYGRSLLPWGVNRALRRVTGRTYPELYAAWHTDLRQRYAAQAAAIRARGLREGRRITRSGRVVSSPRFVPPACAGTEPELLYFRDDGEARAGFYRVPLWGSREPELVVRASGQVATFLPDCALVFDSTAPSERHYSFSDLFALAPGESAPSGREEARRRLTVGLRAREPAASPDGRLLAFVTQHAGTATLRLAELDGAGDLRNTRRLVPSGRYEQAFTPRFSPDGRRVAYGVWTRGGFRDVRVVDVASGAVTLVTRDRALDQQPSWSPDGRTLFFTSDRTGVANVYAYDLEEARLQQVTNVITGAYMPQVSPDGRTLVYVGYGAGGFDLFALPLDRRSWLPALPPPDRPGFEPSVAPRRWPVERYDPLPSLRPRNYRLAYGTGTFGNALTVSTHGFDAVGFHAFTGELTYETEGPEWLASLDYWFRRMPAELRATAFRSAQPRNDYRVNEMPTVVTEHLWGVTTGVTLPLPAEYDYQSAALSFTVADYSQDLPETRLDPSELPPPQIDSGIIAAAHAGYYFSNVESSVYSISAERGFTFGLGVDFADPALGSESTLAAVNASFTGYLRTPWHPHHVLALAASGGSSAGSYARRGLFSTGGFADKPAFDVYTSGLRQSAFVLRGYEPAQFIGSDYALFNAEYRFPVLYAERGVSTLPAFLRTVSGALFADWGGAFYELDPDAPLDVLRLGLGGELWFDLSIGYRVPTTLRLGLAHGLDDEAPDGIQSYFVAASAF